MLDDALVKLKAFLFDHLLTAWVTAIENRHIVSTCHFVDCIHQREEVLFDVNILLTVSREEEVFTLLKTKFPKNIGCLNLREDR